MRFLAVDGGLISSIKTIVDISYLKLQILHFIFGFHNTYHEHGLALRCCRVRTGFVSLKLLKLEGELLFRRISDRN